MATPTDRVRVLHVDDESDAATVADRLRRAEDRLDVTTAPDAAAGLDRIAEDDVDCVVAGHDLPERDGVAFLRAVRARDPDLPFLLFTGAGDEAVASAAISAGVTDYLRKDGPANPYARLADRIVEAAERSGAREGPPGEETARDDPEGDAGAPPDRRRWLEQAAGDLPGILYRCRNESHWPMEYVDGDCESVVGHSAAALEAGRVTLGDDLIHPADRKAARETVQSALEAGEPFELTYRVRTAADEVRWVWERGRPVHDDAAGPTALEGFITPLPEQEANRSDLLGEESFVETVLDTFDDVVYVFDTDLNFVWWNDRATEVSGYTDEELAEMGPTEFFAGEDADRIGESVEQLLETGSSRVEAHIVMKDGREVPYEFRGRTLTGPDGDVRGFCGVARDITERRARERELEQYETLVETAADGVYAQDPDGRYTYVNSYVESLTGYDREELLGERPSMLFDEPRIEEFREAIRSMIAGERDVATVETEVRTADGELVPVESRITLLPAEDGRHGTIGVVREISERRERERELERQRRRLEEFASVVSHDLRNPLNVAQGRLGLAREECDSDHLDAVTRAHERMRVLIEELLALAREGEAAVDPEPVALSELAEDCWALVDTDDAELVVETDRSVVADRTRLRQLVENLVRNSVEHGSTGSRTESGDSVEHGSTSSRTGSDDSVEHGSEGDRGAADDCGDPDDGESPLTITVGDLPDGFYVADDGRGIPPEERDQVFDAGYSTTDEGTGLGLSIVSEVAAAHGWDVSVSDGADGGARFEVTNVDRP